MSDAVVTRDIVAAPPRSRAKRARKTLALGALAIAFAAAGAWYGHTWWTTGRFTESTDDAYVGGDVTTISPHVAGFVADIAVADNARVRAGELLVRIDKRDVQAAYDHAQAVVEARAASLASLRAQSVQQQSAIQQSVAEVGAKMAQAAFADEDARRYASLAQTNAGSRQDAQRTLAADQAARAGVISARAGLEAARQQLGVLDTEMAEARAAIAQAVSDLQTARLNLGYTEIRSPIDGYVGNRSAQVGAYVSEGAYLLSIIPAHGLWVDANFKENQLARMRRGQSATIIADAVPGHVFRGHVVSLAPGTGAVFSVIPAENATGNFTKIVQRVPVRIALDAGDAMLGALRPGLSTTVSVDTRSAP
ncbi:MAG TPA: HlyD family secretion protein [Acetobacteraceae bacterium]